MIIRATKKVLNLSGMDSVKNNLDMSELFPGEWYVDLISLGKPGKFGLQFLHSPTMISVVVPGRSLNKVIGQFKIRVENFLMRHKYEKLIPLFSLDSNPDIYCTLSRSLQAHMNQIKETVSYHCSKAKSVDKINYNWIEDIFLDYPFHSTRLGKDYQFAIRILDKYMNEL